MKRGDKGINPLDEAAKEHDIFYDRFKDTSHLHIADKILQNKAWKRVISKDASLGERAAALLTTGAMKVKRTLGMGLSNHSTKKKKKPQVKRKKKKGAGLRRRRRRQVGEKGLTFNSLVQKARNAIKKKEKVDNLGKAANIAIGVVKREMKKK